jgi:hypothetical protein
MKIGAVDFVQKPFEIEEMELKVEKALELKSPAESRSTTCGTPSRRTTTSTSIVGGSGALQQVLGVVTQGGHAATRRCMIKRRDGHGQGTDRRRDPPQLAAGRPQGVREGELRGAAGEPARIRIVRPREGRLHRAPTASASAGSSRPMAARCSSTKSAT